MVQVYLPMGYPQLSGLEFANVIYQGNVVRLYTVPKDPRTEAQLQQRRLLADISKVRASLGSWGKAACKTALGARWSTVIWQCVKADIEGWWSAALEEWDDFAEPNKEAWRTACPYQATYNDMGQIYFGLVRLVAHAIVHYSNLSWGSSTTWTEAQSATATTWWTKQVIDAVPVGITNDSSSKINKTQWDRITHAASYGGQYYQSVPWPTRYVEFYFYGRSFDYGYLAGPTMYEVKIYVDGVLARTLWQNTATERPQQSVRIDTGVKGLHYVRVDVSQQNGSFDFVKVY